MIWELHVRTYELDDGKEVLVLEHIFYGSTRAEALRYAKSHSQTDAFFKACGKSDRFFRFRGIECTSEVFWTKRC